MYSKLLLAVSFAVLCAACAPEEAALPVASSVAEADPTEGLEECARGFLEALEHGDPGAAEPYLTERARVGLAGGGGWQIDADALESWQILSSEVQGGERADEGQVTAQLVVHGELQVLRLAARCEDELWAIFGMTVVLSDGAEWPIDLEAMAQLAETVGSGLEDALGDWQDGYQRRQASERLERFAALSEITVAEHEQRWRIDVRAEGEPAHEVLAEVLAGTSMEVQTRRELGQPISCELLGVSRLFAVEWIARELDLRPVYPDPNSDLGRAATESPSLISFAQGARERAQAVTASGPFIVEVSELSEQPPHATGTLALTVRGLGLAPEALALCGEMSEVLVVDQLQGPGGAELRADAEARFWTQPSIRGDYFQVDLSLELRGLLREVQSLELVSGFVQLSLPVQLTSTELAALETGVAIQETRAEGWEIVHSQRDGTQHFELRADGTRPDNKQLGGKRLGGMQLDDVRVLFDPRDDSGAPVAVNYEGVAAYGGLLEGDLQLGDPAAAIGLKIAKTRTLAYPFELSKLPLSSYEQQPYEPLDLVFDGLAPLSVSFDGWEARQDDHGDVRLELVNASNKAVESALVRFVYLDADERVLGDFPHALSGSHAFDGPEPLVAEAGRTSGAYAAFFLPEGTRSLRVEVERIEFQDASVWVPADE